ncbi:MAG: hypothetical protein INR62_11975, partial [Rhodospirillales bacterium]|nr:hypothetical protein [Acetobacter sp.]
AALALAPLVLVAWADNDVGLKEHETIMHVAEEVGLKPGNEAHDLLFDWMLSPPSATLLPVWEAFTKSFIAKLDDQARVALRDEVMGRARRVAEAQGGIFRFGRISSAESAMLDRIALVLS